MEQELETFNLFEKDDSPTLDFGRYKGRSYLDVALTEQHYCAWASQLNNPEPKMQMFLDWLTEHRMMETEPKSVQDSIWDLDDKDGGSQVIEFGMHKGRTYTDVASNEPGYSSAIRRVAVKCKGMQRFADWLESMQPIHVDADATEREVECDHFEYWIEKEEQDDETSTDDADSYQHTNNFIDEIHGVSHTEIGDKSVDYIWDITAVSAKDPLTEASTPECGTQVPEEALPCQEMFATFPDIEDSNQSYQTPEETVLFLQDCSSIGVKRDHEWLENGNNLGVVTSEKSKRARTCDEVRLAKAMENDLRLTPPELSME